jgi:hypothetical protein
MSVKIIGAPRQRVVKKVRKRSSDTSDVITEEQKYQKNLKWLKSHRYLTGEGGQNPGEEPSGNQTSSSRHTIVESVISNSNCYE